MDEKFKQLPPINLPIGKRTEGTLFNVPVKRIVKKSAFLRAREKEQRPSTTNVTPITAHKAPQRLR